MMQEGHISTPPSAQTLFKVLGGATLLAAALLLVVVLPAEYGIDPLGTGKALGLTGLSAAAESAPASTVVAPQPSAASDASIVPILKPGEEQSRWGASAVVKGAYLAQPRRFGLDSREISLAPGEGMEIKYHLPKGAGLTYSWMTTGGPVLFDFHGEPEDTPAGKSHDDYFESYQRDDQRGADQAHGTFIAPSTGIHGWYWQNKGTQPIQLKLVSAGFYDWIFQSRDEVKSRLEPIDADSIASHPGVPDVKVPRDDFQ